MKEIQVGKVMLTPKGEYDSTKTYTRLDAVTYQGSSYVCLVDTSTTPPGNDWQLLAQKGDNGQPGSPGKDGQPGRDGNPGQDGKDGVTPHVDATTGNWFIGTTNTGVKAQGPAGQPGSDGKPGQNGHDGSAGKDGQNGISPHIDKATGHWFIGTTDTGVSAQGPQGEPGQDGKDGQSLDVTNYYTKKETDTKLSTKADKSQLPDLSEYAKRSDIPAPVDLSGYAKDDVVQAAQSTANQALDATKVKVVTSGTLASLGIGKYEVQESASDAPTDDWGMLEVTVGQHYAKQVFTITGNGRNVIYSRVRDYDAANYGPWNEVTNSINSTEKDTSKKPSDYSEGFYREMKSFDVLGINRDSLSTDAQDGTSFLVTTYSYGGWARQTAMVLDSERPMTFKRNGNGDTWYSWEVVHTSGGSWLQS